MRHLKVFIVGLIAIFILMWFVRNPGITHLAEIEDTEARSLATLYADQAKLENKKLLLYFSGENCPPCMAMERTVFTRQEWKDHLKKNIHFVEIHFPNQFDPNNPHLMSGYRLAQSLGFRGTPFLVLIDQDGAVQKTQTGYSGAHASAMINWAK